MVHFSSRANAKNPTFGIADDSSAEIDFWNGLTQPLVLLNPHLAKDNRWDWTRASSTTEPTGTVETTVVNAADPIFSGVTITGGAADLMISQLGTDWLPTGKVGGGEILATGTGAAGESLTGLARFEAGDALAARGTTFGGSRLLLGDFQVGDLTGDGLQVLDNALVGFGLSHETFAQTSDDSYFLYANAPWSETATSGGVVGNNAPYAWRDFYDFAGVQPLGCEGETCGCEGGSLKAGLQRRLPQSACPTSCVWPR